MVMEVWHVEDDGSQQGIVAARELRLAVGIAARDGDGSGADAPSLHMQALYRKVVAGQVPGLAARKVAEVQTDDLERAFELTNSIESSWSVKPGPGVKPLGTRLRSTSVGDFMVQDGRAHAVASIGFLGFAWTPPGGNPEKNSVVDDRACGPLKNIAQGTAQAPFYIWANEDCANRAEDFEAAKRIRRQLIDSGAQDVYIVDADGVEVVDAQIEAEEAAMAQAQEQQAVARPQER